MSRKLLEDTVDVLAELREQGLYKSEKQILSSQSANIDVGDGSGSRHYLNFCANNYLGLANNPQLIAAAKQGLDSHGFGMASVRFICGTQDIHKQLESRLSQFLGSEDAILFSSCFDANAGIFEVLLSEQDAIISDALNHASIIDGVRLCKAKRFRYANSDMADLENCLEQASDCRYRIVVTDGVFSMDGVIANLQGICDLAEKYDAMVMVDDSHAVGFMGIRGTGTPEFCGVGGRVQLLSGTFGKALGGASGGYIAGPAVLVDLLRQRARPYLFSNSLAPAIVAATLEVLDMIERGDELRRRLQHNARRFRAGMKNLGFTLAGADHPIIPVMIGNAVKAQKFAASLLDQGIYVVAFAYPVVPRGQARIRTQMSAIHSDDQIDHAIGLFGSVGRDLGLI